MFGFFGVKKRNKAYLEDIEKILKLYERDIATYGIDARYYDLILDKSSQIHGDLKKSQVFTECVEQVMKQAAQELEAARKAVKEKKEQLEKEERERKEREAKEREKREREAKDREEREARERKLNEKYKGVLTYAMLVGEKIKHTKNDYMILQFENLQNILTLDELKKALADHASDSYSKKLTLIKETISKLESMANAHPDSKRYEVLPKSPMPPLFKIGPKSLLTLLESCLASKTTLQQCHVNSVIALSAYKIWTNRDQFSFLGEEAKTMRRKAESLNMKIDTLNCAEHYELFQFLDRIENQVWSSLDAIPAIPGAQVTSRGVFR